MKNFRIFAKDGLIPPNVSVEFNAAKREWFPGLTKLEGLEMANGHNGTGGLQNHSLGGLYPYTVRVVERDGRLFCQAFNCISGWVGGSHPAFREFGPGCFADGHAKAETDCEIAKAIDGGYAH